MKNITLLRLRYTARLEKMIEEGCKYEEILEQSKKLDELIMRDMEQRNVCETIDKTLENL